MKAYKSYPLFSEVERSLISSITPVDQKKLHTLLRQIYSPRYDSGRIGINRPPTHRYCSRWDGTIILWNKICINFDGFAGFVVGVYIYFYFRIFVSADVRSS